MLCFTTLHSIVPYINPKFKGSISGIIGAGGNVGAVAFGFCFRQMTSQAAFMMMGFIILFSSVLSVAVFIPGQSGLFCRTKVPGEIAKTVAVEEGGSTPSSKLASDSVASKESETTSTDHSEHVSQSDNSL